LNIRLEKDNIIYCRYVCILIIKSSFLPPKISFHSLTLYSARVESPNRNMNPLSNLWTETSTNVFLFFIRVCSKVTIFNKLRRSIWLVYPLFTWFSHSQAQFIKYILTDQNNNNHEIVEIVLWIYFNSFAFEISESIIAISVPLFGLKSKEW